MAKSEQQKQRKLAKKKAKERRKKHDMIQRQQQVASLAGRMLASSSGAIIYSGVSGLVEPSMGMHVAFFARRGIQGKIALAFFLVDAYCLGVKDAGCKLCSHEQYDEVLKRMVEDRGTTPVSPEFARGFVEGAVAYAQNLGLSPHPDYRNARLLWGDLVPESMEGKFVYGDNGRPRYVAGPFDDMAKQRMILNQLNKSVGEGNYDFVMSMGRSFSEFGEPYIADDDDEDYEDDLDEEAESELTIDAVAHRRIDP